MALPPRSATPTLLVEVVLDAVHGAFLPHLDPTVTAWDPAVGSLWRSAVGEPLIGRHGDPRWDLLESTRLTAHRPGRSVDPETCWNDELVAHPDLRAATVTISVPQDLLRELDASPVARGFAEWVQRAARRHGALTGYVTLDEHVSAGNRESALELAVGGLPWLHSLLGVAAARSRPPCQQLAGHRRPPWTPAPGAAERGEGSVAGRQTDVRPSAGWPRGSST